MPYPRLMILLISVLTLGLFNLGTSVHAAVPDDSTNTITLENTVQFEDTEGEDVLVSPGTYSVTAGKETLHLTANDSKTAVTIAADENSHTADIPIPTAASIPSQDEPLANMHVVILFLPDGHALQAIGTYPGIQSRGISPETDLSGSPTTVTFEKAVHFIAPDGSPVVAAPGSYTAEVAQDWIRLIPGEERHNALLIEAQKGINDTEVEELVALSLPGSTEKELDLHHMMLLLPTGQTLEATGSYSGIQPRGWLKKTFKKAKKRVSRTYKKARGTVRKVGKGVGRTAKKVGKDVGKTAKKVGKGVSQAALKAKRAAEQAAKFAAAQAKAIAQKGAILACHGLFKAQAALASVQGKAHQWVGKAVNKIRQNSKVVNDIIAAGEKFQQIQKQFIADAIKKSFKYNKPALLKKITYLMKPKTICEQGIPTAAKGLGSLLAGKNPIRSRSIAPVMSVGPQVAFATPKILGGEGGIGLVFPPGSATNPKLYYFAGGTASLPQLSMSGVLQVATWNPAMVKNQKEIGGGYLALGYTIPLKELSKIVGWIPGEQGVPPYKGGGGKDVVVVLDIIFSWPKGKSKPILWPPAGVVVSPGVSGGLSKLKENLVTKYLGRVTLQGGYTWVGNKNIW